MVMVMVLSLFLVPLLCDMFASLYCSPLFLEWNVNERARERNWIRCVLWWLLFHEHLLWIVYVRERACALTRSLALSLSQCVVCRRFFFHFPLLLPLALAMTFHIITAYIQKTIISPFTIHYCGFVVAGYRRCSRFRRRRHYSRCCCCYSMAFSTAYSYIRTYVLYSSQLHSIHRRFFFCFSAAAAFPLPLCSFA